MNSKMETKRLEAFNRLGRCSILVLTTWALGSCSDIPGMGSGSGSSDGSVSDYDFSVDDDSAYEVSGTWGRQFPKGRREFQLTNSSKSAIVEWNLDGAIAWLSFSSTSGKLFPGTTETVVVQINQPVARLLSIGRYPADVVFKDLRNPEGEIYLAFALTVNPEVGGSGLYASPEDGYDLNFDLSAGIVSSDLTLLLGNDAPNPINWLASTDQDWLQLNNGSAGILGSGTTSNLAVSIDGELLAARGEGLHSAFVTLQEDAPLSPPLPIEVRVTLDQGSSDGRVTAGLQALWDFEDASDPTRVPDVSGVSPALDLSIEDPANTIWVPGILSITQPTRVASSGAATQLASALMASGEITLESWVTPANVTQSGPARIMTMSSGSATRDFTLGQGMWGSAATDSYNARLRTTATDPNGMPMVDTGGGVARAQLQHVVYTRAADGTAKIWVDGNLELMDQTPGLFQNWDSGFQFALANEISASRPWLGVLHLSAIYDRALTDAEVQQNYSVGPGDADVALINVDPATNFGLNGQEGTDFSGITKTYTVKNPGTAPVSWGVYSDASWITLTGSQQGNLNPGQSSQLIVGVDPQVAATFTPGTYTGTLYFTNDTNSYGDTQRLVSVYISPPGGGSGDKPGPNNTGPYDESILETVPGMTITVDGTVIENASFTGMVTIQANNVTIRNFRVDGGGTAQYGIRPIQGFTGNLLEDGEVMNIYGPGIYGGGFTARRLNVHDTGTDGFKCRSNTLVESCWVHNLGLKAGAHADCNQTRKGSNITLRGNFLDLPANTGGGYKSNSASINQAELGDISNLVIDGNWLNGGNYTIYFRADAKYGFSNSDCHLTNNRFGRDFRYGVLNVGGNVTNLNVDGNVWDDTGEWMDINDNY